MVFSQLLHRDRFAVLLLLAAGMCLSSVTGVRAAPALDEVMLYGVPVRPYDYLGARITAASGNTASLGMGAKDGLRQHDSLWLFREIDDVYRKIGTVVAFEVKERSTLVVGQGGLQLAAGDLAVIPARELDLFVTRKRFDYRVRRQIVEQQGKNSYDTRQFQANGAELLLSRSVERALQYDAWRRRSFRIRPAGPAFYNITILRAVADSIETRMGARKARPLTAAERIERLVIPETGEFIGFPLTIFSFDPQSSDEDEDGLSEQLTDRAELPLGYDPMKAFRPLRAYLRKHARLSDPPPTEEELQSQG